MRPRRSCGIYLLMLLWIVFPTPATSGQLLTEEELDLMIASESSWSGVEVKILVKGILEAAHKEIRNTAAEAAKEAVIPVVAELAAERVKAQKWEEAWRQERASQVLIKILLFASAAVSLVAAGAALGAAAF